MFLTGQQLTKGQPYTFPASLKAVVSGTLTTGSKIVTGISADYFDYLKKARGAAIAGAGIPGGTTISEVCADKRELTLSLASTGSGLTELTITTGSWSGLVLEFQMTTDKDPNYLTPILTKTSPSGGITISDATTASISITASDTSTLELDKTEKVSIVGIPAPISVPYTTCLYRLRIMSGGPIEAASGAVKVSALTVTPTPPVC